MDTVVWSQEDPRSRPKSPHMLRRSHVEATGQDVYADPGWDSAGWASFHEMPRKDGPEMDVVPRIFQELNTVSAERSASRLLETLAAIDASPVSGLNKPARSHYEATKRRRIRSKWQVSHEPLQTIFTMARPASRGYAIGSYTGPKLSRPSTSIRRTSTGGTKHNRSIGSDRDPHQSSWTRKNYQRAELMRGRGCDPTTKGNIDKCGANVRGYILGVCAAPPKDAPPSLSAPSFIHSQDLVPIMLHTASPTPAVQEQELAAQIRPASVGRSRDAKQMADETPQPRPQTLEARAVASGGFAMRMMVQPQKSQALTPDVRPQSPGSPLGQWAVESTGSQSLGPGSLRVSTVDGEETFELSGRASALSMNPAQRNK